MCKITNLLPDNIINSKYYLRFNKLIIILMTSALEILPHHRREPKTRHICVVKTVVLFILFRMHAECWISVLRSKRIIKPARASLKNNILKTVMLTNVCDFFLKTQHSLTYYSKAMCPSSVYYFSQRFFQSPAGGVVGAGRLSVHKPPDETELREYVRH